MDLIEDVAGTPVVLQTFPAPGGGGFTESFNKPIPTSGNVSLGFASAGAVTTMKVSVVVTVRPFYQAA